MVQRRGVDPSELAQLHQRLLDGDALAVTAIASVMLRVVPQRLLRKWPHVDPAFIEDGVDRALLAYLANPGSFDSTRASLPTFIKLGAERNLIDVLRVERAQHVRNIKWAEEWVRRAHSSAGPGSPDLIRAVWPRLMSSRRDLTDHQWTLVQPLFLRSATGRRGRRPKPIRPILDGILWVLRAVKNWRSLPARYPRYQTCHEHFQKWCELGVLKDALDRLEADLSRPIGLS